MSRHSRPPLLVISAEQAAANRRRYPRRTKPFQGVFFNQPGSRLPTVGLDISGGGLCVLLQQPIEAPTGGDLAFAVVVGDQPVTLATRFRWSNTIVHRGVDHYRYGVKISKIADQDWDRLMHWTIDSNTDALSEGVVLSAKQRDAMLAPDMQRQVGRTLVTKRRLDPLREDRLPLIEYKFENYTMRSGTPYMLFNVRSKAHDEMAGAIAEHHSALLIPCEDGLVRLLD